MYMYKKVVAEAGKQSTFSVARKGSRGNFALSTVLGHNVLVPS